MVAPGTLVFLPPDWAIEVEMTARKGDPVQPIPYAGSGMIAQLNYDREGAINGLVLDSGVIARTPPLGVSDLSATKPGARIAVSGLARTTPAGKTVLDVQSIGINGQTISMNAGPPPGPGGHGERGGQPGSPPPPPPPGQ